MEYTHFFYLTRCVTLDTIMDRFFRLFNKEFSKISEAAIVLGTFTFFSQILAIVRDRLLAGQIGPGDLLDVYYAAFRIPDLLFTLGAALVSVSILLPFFDTQLQIGKEKARSFINDVFTSFFGFIVVLAILLWIAMPYIIPELFSGFNEVMLADTIYLSRIMLLSPILLGISNLFATITQAYKKFFVYALAPVFYNIGIIIGVVWLYPEFGIPGFAYGVVIGALLHMAIQVPVVISQGFLPKLSSSIDWNHIWQVLKNSLPRTLTLSMSKIVFLIFVSLASGLATGAISVFNLAYNLQSVPLALIGVSYSVAAFPTLVQYYNSENFHEFMQHVMIPIRQIIFWSLPVISLFIVLRAQIVRVILGTGNFDWSDTRLTAAALAMFIISVVAQSITLLIVRAYYAAGKTWKPLLITISSSVFSVLGAYSLVSFYQQNELFQWFFEYLLRVQGVPGSVVIMLPFAFSIGMFINLLFLWLAFKKDFNYQPIYQISTTVRQSLTASLLIGISAYFSLQIFDPFFRDDKVLDVLGHAGISGVLGVLIGICYLLLIKNQEIMLLVGLMKRKFGTVHLRGQGDIGL